MKYFDIVSDSYLNIKENVSLSGMTDELFCVYINNLFNNSDKSILILTSTLYDANNIYSNLINNMNNVLLFPMDDFITSEALAISPDLMLNRLDTLNKSLIKEKHIIVTNLMGYLRYLPTQDTYKNSIINLKVGMEYDIKDLVKKLVNIGYNRESLVTKTGEIGVRGFILDIFPINETNPIRIEFFGDEIESIRYFDESTQKSNKQIDNIEIYPYTEFIVQEEIDVLERKQKYLCNYQKVSSVYEYFSNPLLIIKDKSQIEVAYNNLYNEINDYRIKDKDYNGNYMNELLYPSNYIEYNTLSDNSNKNNINFNSKGIMPFNDNIDLLNKYLMDSLNDNKTIILCLKDFQIRNLTKFLKVEYNITDADNIVLNKINIIEKDLNYGFIYNDYIVIGSSDIYKVHDHKKHYKSKFKYASKINDITKLEIGDYVVHDVYGIGIYRGIKSLNNIGNIKDYLIVEYLDNDKLYIPVEKIDLLSKYSSGDLLRVKLNKLGTSEWVRTKSRVREQVHSIANKLIKLYAEREMKKGFSFSEDNELQELFEKAFIYDETADQLKAVIDIKNDMESTIPMDRLLCGDVGYGKTEVAFRAMFKAVLDSKQVLYLCPTTILSNQQYVNALDRFSGFPVNIGLLNRFTTKKEQKRIIEGLKDGTIDIVFGTHRLLSNDIKPKDLGLLVIDEEQRFGVTHKEKIKEYKTNIDVLTLTATPIPRTLQMSMIGIRSLSLIETPPVDRYPVQTYVIEDNDQLVKDAIYKEISRGGQVFYLYNRVETIVEEVDKLRRLVPDARISFAHGKLSKSEMEDIMQEFIDHETDILVCTTIIETGIDIPNVNTLIIKDADRFGLSQLYQIRGRVGRSNKIAYAYLMYKPYKMLTDSAIKRLKVIKDFTELGSGFSIATRDLSIRGAGDILGSEQAGFIDNVGIDLYLKILNNEINKIKGIEVDEEIDETPLISVSTHISDNYVDDDNLKIYIHKKINEIDSFDKLKTIKNELEDRFGKVDEDLIIYMYQEWFEKLAKSLDIEKVKQTKTSIELVFSPEKTKNIDGEKLFEKAYKVSNMFRFKLLSGRLIIILDTVKLDKHFIYYLIDLLKDMS